MRRDELPVIPQVAAAVEAVVELAKAERCYPDIFDESKLPETIQAVILQTKVAQDTLSQRRQAMRLSAYHLGLYMQQHGMN